MSTHLVLRLFYWIKTHFQSEKSGITLHNWQNCFSCLKKNLTAYETSTHGFNIPFHKDILPKFLLMTLNNSDCMSLLWMDYNLIYNLFVTTIRKHHNVTESLLWFHDFQVKILGLGRMSFHLIRYIIFTSHFMALWKN